MDKKLDFYDIPDRVRALKCYGWVYKHDGKPVNIYHEGLVGVSLEKEKKGPTYEALRLWELGLRTPTVHLLNNLVRVLTEEMKNPPLITLAMLSSNVPLRELYAVLGLSPDKTEEMLFTHWAKETGLCKSFTFPSAEQAEQFSHSHRPGLYLGERIRLGNSKEDSQKFALAVYGKVPVSTQKHNKTFFIPTMLTLRSTTGATLFSYRGAVGRMARGLEWAFFQEGQGVLDRIRVMTSDGNGLLYAGMMLTITEGPAYEPISYNVSIRRHHDLSSWKKTSQFLTRSPTWSPKAEVKVTKRAAQRKREVLKRGNPK